MLSLKFIYGNELILGEVIWIFVNFFCNIFIVKKGMIGFCCLNFFGNNNLVIVFFLIKSKLLGDWRRFKFFVCIMDWSFGL